MSEGMKGAIAKAEELNSQIKGSVILQQFKNPANPDIHYMTTANEIIEDAGKFDVFISCVGTGGSITGIGKRLKEKSPEIEIIAVEPKGSPVLSGGVAGPHKIQGIGAGFIPEIIERSYIDKIIQIIGVAIDPHAGFLVFIQDFIFIRPELLCLNAIFCKHRILHISVDQRLIAVPDHCNHILHRHNSSCFAHLLPTIACTLCEHSIVMNKSLLPALFQTESVPQSGQKHSLRYHNG